MDSASLLDFGFRTWSPFNTANSAGLIAAAPATPGVYVIRCRTPFPRSSGLSDILYVGSAGNRDGLRMRLRQYFHPGPTQRTNQRLLARCGDSTDYEISYIVSGSPQAAGELEAEILNRYVTAHHELPPENRVLPVVRRVVSLDLMSGAEQRAPAGDPSNTVMKPTAKNFAAVWSRIQSHAGTNFSTITGKPFRYTIAHGAVRPDRTNWQIPKSDFEKALGRVPLRNTTVIQDLQGPSFIYAVLMDERIRAGEW